MIQLELEALKKEMLQIDDEIVEIKQQRSDLILHVKTQQKVKKSKNSEEIKQGSILIFDTGAP